MLAVLSCRGATSNSLTVLLKLKVLRSLTTRSNLAWLPVFNARVTMVCFQVSCALLLWGETSNVAGILALLAVQMSCLERIYGVSAQSAACHSECAGMFQNSLCYMEYV